LQSLRRLLLAHPGLFGDGYLKVQMPTQSKESSDDEALLDPLFAALGKLYAQKEENRKKYAKGGRPNDPCPTCQSTTHHLLGCPRQT